MINDTVDILNAKVVNIDIEFTAIAKRGFNKYDLLAEIYDELGRQFAANKMQIGERFYITDIYTAINRIDGVVDTTEVFVNQKLTAKHSQVSFNMSEALSANGRYIEVPENVALEIRYPNEDIKGTIL
jgi:peptide deformylase